MKTQKEILKKQLEQFWENLQNKLNESHLFNLLKERYESLNTIQQKTLKYITGTALLILILVMPLFYLISSLSYWNEFKVKYQLSQRLLNLRTNPTAFHSTRSSASIKQAMEKLIKKYRPEDYSLKNKKGGNRKSQIKTEVFEIKVDHLNIKQVIQLGTDLSVLPSVRLESLQIRESTQYANHYDTTYEAHHYFMERLNRRRPRVSAKSRKPQPKKKPKQPKQPANTKSRR